MKLLKNKWILLLAVLTAIGIFAAFSFTRTPAAKYFTAKADMGDIHDAVEATGTIDAVTTVQVGSQVSGTIAKLGADFNSRVKAGQVIAQIDPSLFRGALLQSQADLQDAKANLAAAEAQLAKTKATQVQSAADYTRTAGLAKEGVMSAQQLDAAKATADSATAAVNAADAQVTQARAQVQQKAAALTVAQTNLDHTIIRSPIDGTVVARNIDVGQTVAASLQAPTLFNIAQDLTKMRVYVATDESDVGQIHIGSDTTFKVDAFPSQVFHGQVVQIRMNPTTVQNVVTYQTVVEFDNPQQKLFPGMTAYVTIPVADAVHVVKVPNSALRFTPDLKADQLKAALQAAGIGSGRPQGTQRKSAAANAANGAAQPHQTRQDTAVVWKVGKDNQLIPVQVKTGITDHTSTQVAQVLHGELKPGDVLAIGSESAMKKGGSGSPMGGGMMR